MLYRDMLRRDWKLWQQFKLRRAKPLPVVLSREEVRHFLKCVKVNRYKVIFALLYHCGLRISEALKLRPSDIDGERLVVRVREGTGGKPREVPLSPDMLRRLRLYYGYHLRALACGGGCLGVPHRAHGRASLRLLGLYVYHSCNNRACPQCGGHDQQVWAAKQSARLLPVPDYMLTPTVPQQLRRLFLRAPAAAYDTLFRAASGALQDILGKSKHMGGQSGFMVMLHT